jgi:hypothetical protein
LFQQELANSAFKNGDFALGSDIGTQLFNERQAAMQTRSQSKILGEEVTQIEQENEHQKDINLQLKDAMEREKLGEKGLYIDPNGIVEGENPQPLTAWRVGRDLETDSGQFLENGGGLILQEEWIALQSHFLDRDKDMGTGNAADWKTWISTRGGVSGIRGLQTTRAALDTYINVMDGVADLFEAGGDPRAYLSAAGDINKFALKIEDTVSSVAGSFGWNKEVRTDPGDPNTAVLSAGQLKNVTKGNTAMFEDKDFVDKYGDLLDGIALPASVSDNATKAASFKAGIVRLAYAVARANEPGARQLSDRDFKNALDIIGGAASNPEQLATVIRQNLPSNLEEFQINVTSLTTSAPVFGITPDQALQAVFGTTLKGFNEKANAANLRLSRAAGLPDPVNVPIPGGGSGPVSGLD